ncbi:hypothetical protein [Aquisediminimonas sediminicola]|uniref:hypothetical protein n=1 Tax=Alteraquisediminimonas sediminicola TaxID=2676787 RepID=UPI001C8DEE14|nr:hypothetical protein [Aquisediminimonas sediminicola]
MRGNLGRRTSRYHFKQQCIIFALELEGNNVRRANCLFPTSDALLLAPDAQIVASLLGTLRLIDGDYDSGGGCEVIVEAPVEFGKAGRRDWCFHLVFSFDQSLKAQNNHR